MATYLIISVAIIATGTALYQALPDFGLMHICFTARTLWQGNWGGIIWLPLGFLVNPLIPVSKLISAYGLLRSRMWAWRVAIISLTLDLLLRLIEAINYTIQSYRYRGFKIPEVSPDAHVQIISMWPSYIIGLLSAFAILLLLRPSVKKVFKEVNEKKA